MSHDRTPFFNTTRVLTLLGMFSLPEYATSVHLLGTSRMGVDPATSVIDKYHRSRRPQPVALRQQPGDVGPRPTNDDDSGAGVSRAGEQIAQFAKRGEI